MVMASWTGFNIYGGADWGCGGLPRCVLPGPPSSLVDGVMYALPPNAATAVSSARSAGTDGGEAVGAGGGGVEVTLCFRVEVYEALLRDAELGRFCTALD